jgi:hypothetical protein
MRAAADPQKKSRPISLSKALEWRGGLSSGSLGSKSVIIVSSSFAPHALALTSKGRCGLQAGGDAGGKWEASFPFGRGGADHRRERTWGRTLEVDRRGAPPRTSEAVHCRAVNGKQAGTIAAISGPAAMPSVAVVPSERPTTVPAVAIGDQRACVRMGHEGRAR